MEKEISLKESIGKIIYIVFILLVVFSSIYGNIYIRMVPLLFILGLVGRIGFKKQVMTTFLGFIVSLCINYLKTPSDIAYIFLMSGIMAFHIALGEVFSEFLLKCLKKEENAKKSKKIISGILLVCVFILELGVHQVTNGNPLSYQEAKKKLLDYMNTKYENGNQFQELNVNYYVYPSPRYVFFMVNAGNVSKFSIYLTDNVIIDEYEEENKSNQLERIESTLTDCIVRLEDNSKYDNINIKAKFVEDNKICLNIEKNVSTINQEELENFAKEIVSYLEDIKKSTVYQEIDQLLISLKNPTNIQENLVSTIYIEAYEKNLEERSILSYKYILKAFHTEVVD